MVERKRSRQPFRPPQWAYRAVIVAMVIYVLVQAWRMWTHPAIIGGP